MINASGLMERAETILLTLSHHTMKEASAQELHNAVSLAAMEALTPLWVQKERERSGGRRAFYLSAEYLMGRLVFNNLYCLGLLDGVRGELRARGVDPDILEDVEDDAFGNGGLGRLAACFLDSAATHGVPLTGYGLRYRYGLFRQSIEDDRQREYPDDWSRYGDPWSVRRDDLAVTVSMKTGDVLAVPYDMPVVGFGAENVGTLRLWQCESLHEIDFPLFNAQQYAAASRDKNRAEDITKFLYPNDTRRGGKLLRVRQQYVLVSASLQDMLRQYKARHGCDYSRFAAEHAVQLNDTHPVLAIPELIRLLEDDRLGFEEAFAVASSVFSYTNHTVMQEALEKWDLSLLSAVSPRIVEVIREIDRRFRGENPGDVSPRHCVIEGRRVHMAQLAVYVCHTTNGVAAIHSEILKKDVFSEWYRRYPERFRNVTNGITQRRWLGLCNPELCALLKDALGSDAFLTDLSQLSRLNALLDGPGSAELIRRFREIKRRKKAQLSDAVRRETGLALQPERVFDVQVKRLHEYKRQLMNALSILALHRMLKAGELPGWRPAVFLFGAKAAPGYDRAKAVIRLINQIADRINADPDTASLLSVLFIPNYNCSWAEKIIPAADISEQISPAGTEASGTGNMKLMLNGAVTLGTFDGANIEIVQQAGRENNYIFGATVEELDAIRERYDPKALYKKDPVLRAALDALADGTFADPDGALAELRASILEGASWHRPDHYFIAQDFPSYLAAKIAANRDTADEDAFAMKCLRNIAGAGRFSSDRTIAEYAAEIWKV